MGYWSWDGELEDLKGVVMRSVERVPRKYEGDAIVFTAEDGRKWSLHHSQDCCENVELDEIHGDLDDLVGTPILISDERTNRREPPKDSEYTPESYTWTFFEFATIKGYVTVRFYGTSNGYYSEGADLYKWEERD